MLNLVKQRIIIRLANGISTLNFCFLMSKAVILLLPWKKYTQPKKSNTI